MTFQVWRFENQDAALFQFRGDLTDETRELQCRQVLDHPAAEEDLLRAVGLGLEPLKNFASPASSLFDLQMTSDSASPSMLLTGILFPLRT